MIYCMTMSTYLSIHSDEACPVIEMQILVGKRYRFEKDLYQGMDGMRCFNDLC